MKVIVNALGYVGQSGGAGGAGVFLNYIVEQLSKICDIDVLIAPNTEGFAVRPKGARFIELPYLRADVLQHLRSGPTVVMDPFGGLPCGPFPDDMGLCVVIHDLMHLEQPQYFSTAERHVRSVGFADGLTRADGVITFSHEQAKSIARHFPGVTATVIPHLPYMTLGPHIADNDKANDSPLKGKNFILCPGVKWPHKNHRTLLEAFAVYSKAKKSDLILAMCGPPCAETRFSFLPPANLLGNRIIDLGLVSNIEIRQLFADAKAVFFPSLYEGFGIPVLEAAYLGKMVVASALPVFDEILGPAAYRRVTQPLCHKRWMDAIADTERPDVLSDYESKARLTQRKVNPQAYLDSLFDLLSTCADRYTNPALYVNRSFDSGDRATSQVVATLSFEDIYRAAEVSEGARHASVGSKARPLTSKIFKGAPAEARKQCLRAIFDSRSMAMDTKIHIEFYAWIRLLHGSDLDALNWSANDEGVVDLLPVLRDNEWHLIRAAVPSAAYLDIRGVKQGTTEVSGFGIEIHDPHIIADFRLNPPREDIPTERLTIVVEAISNKAPLSKTIASVAAISEALGPSHALLRWVVLTAQVAEARQGPPAEIPENVRVHFMLEKAPTRDHASGILSIYEPIKRLLLLEAGDLKALLQKENLDALIASSGSYLSSDTAFFLPERESGIWKSSERGRLILLAARTGEPIPLLDPLVVASSLGAGSQKHKPAFGIIETDRTSALSHHSTVSKLFLQGAAALGYEPVLGLNSSAGVVSSTDDTKAWYGFSTQVYSAGSADVFAKELRDFVDANQLGPSDFIFMHSLSPQILLGMARYIAAHSMSCPQFVIRFFSTAEAMAGHRLSYVKILRSIENVRAIRSKLHIFCESRNLMAYYKSAVGGEYPLLLNPEHPSLALVRDSPWFDPNLGLGTTPTLAYFGEAREEKGFDELPAIITALLENPVTRSFQFLIQVGSNRGNDTPTISRASEMLRELSRRHKGQIRFFSAVESPEQFYFLMKHAQGIIAPYKRTAYGKRGTGVTLEALQLGLTVFAWMDTDLFATFEDTGLMVGVRDDETFAGRIAAHYRAHKAARRTSSNQLIARTPAETMDYLLSYCAKDAATNPPAQTAPILWVGNDTYGEGCSRVYSAQKQALLELGRDILELIVPWPDPNWNGRDDNAFDEKVYGFVQGCEAAGLAWVARPVYSAPLFERLQIIERKGPTYGDLKALNEHFSLAPTLVEATANNRVTRTLLNYAHLYSVVRSIASPEGIVCEMHDIVAYQHAVRRGDSVRLSEKIDEFADLGHFKDIVAISAEEQREVAGACSSSRVHWRLPPYVPEAAPTGTVSHATMLVLDELGGIPTEVVQPSLAMLRAFCERPDVQSAFPLQTPFGRISFFRWWVFFGQFEVSSPRSLTKAQFDWLTTSPDRSKGQGLTGLLKLMISARDDLRRSFVTGGKAQTEALNKWASENAEREFGISDRLLREKFNPSATGFERAYSPKSAEILDAIFSAGPDMLVKDPKSMLPIFERLLELERLDLLIVGSAHPSNILSFRWFIEEVHLRHLVMKGKTVFVVGAVCDHLRDLNHPGVLLLGRCERLTPLFNVAQALPLPVIAGSGSPIKTIPALAQGGAVTVTSHIEKAFKLSQHGIPYFDDPGAFAADVLSLLSDATFRRRRRESAERYVRDNLMQSAYVEFWNSVLTF